MEKSEGGLGLTSVVTIVFVILKLIGVINWSWLWVLAPTWIPWVIVILCLIFAALVYTCVAKISQHKRAKT